jgi:asparagine synthase (glutamine-hydrolysing)
MSGIAGIFHLDSQPCDRFDIHCMVESLAHRGPDGAGVWCEGAISLGHRMLWTTPESLLEKLPLTKGNLAITADARIDNRQELIPTLGLERYPAEKITDSDLILAAYKKWGEQCPEKLLGDFAFGIWDGQTQTVFCARDYFGVKPFYYYHQPGRIFAFASEIKALLCLPKVPRKLDEVRIADYLLEHFEDKTSTFYQDIYRLPPAHHLILADREASLKSYWAMNPNDELNLSSDADYAERYLETFTAAVKCRLRSAFPIGSMLSGGLDSSSIACTARTLLKKPLKSFSVIFDDVPECDERPFINAVLADGGIEPHFVHGDRVSLLADLKQVLKFQDEPFDAPNAFLNRSVWQSARQQGVRVLLDGLMGDNVVSPGFGYLSELAHNGRLIALCQELRITARRYRLSPLPALGFYLWNDSLKPRMSQSLLQRWRQWRKQTDPSFSLDPIINPEFARQIGLNAHIQARQASHSDEWQTARQRHCQELMSPFVQTALEFMSKASAEFAIEVRLPFMDRRLVELSLAMPMQQKFQAGWSRLIVRRAMAGILPEKIRWRDGKGHLGANFKRTLLAEQVYLNTVRQSVPLGKYVDMEVLYRMQSVLQSQSHGSVNWNQLLLSCILASWLDKESGYPLAIDHV